MQKEVKGYWGSVIHKQDVSAGREMKEEELSDGMDQASLLDDLELKYDGHSKKMWLIFWEKP